jgi:hypothetical protein
MVDVGQTYIAGSLETSGDIQSIGDWTVVGQLIYNNTDIITTEDDTTLTLDITYPPDMLLSGNGILYWIDLGTATSYANGKEWTFLNNSTEIVGIKNADSTIWRRLPPRWGLRCTLADNGTPAGVWRTIVYPHTIPNAGLYLLDDFMGGTAATCSMGWLSANSGTGSGATTLDYTSSSKQGYTYVYTGTTTTGYAQIYTRSSLLTTSCVNSFVCNVKFSYLSTVAEEYIARIGFGDSTDMSDHTDGMYFEYDRLTNGDVWSINTAAAGTRTETATIISPNNWLTNQILLIESASDASRVDYWIDKVHTGTITTNIPGAADAFGVHAGIIKSAGTTERICHIHHTTLGRYPLTER